MTEASFRQIRQELRKTKRRVKTLIKTLEVQTRLLTSIAQKMDLEIDVEELEAKNGVNVLDIRPALLAQEKETEDGKDDGSEVDDERL